MTSNVNNTNKMMIRGIIYVTNKDPKLMVGNVNTITIYTNRGGDTDSVSSDRSLVVPMEKCNHPNKRYLCKNCNGIIHMRPIALSKNKLQMSNSIEIIDINIKSKIKERDDNIANEISKRIEDVSRIMDETRNLAASLYDPSIDEEEIEDIYNKSKQNTAIVRNHISKILYLSSRKDTEDLLKYQKTERKYSLTLRPNHLISLKNYDMMWCPIKSHNKNINVKIVKTISRPLSLIPDSLFSTPINSSSLYISDSGNGKSSRGDEIKDEHDNPFIKKIIINDFEYKFTITISDELIDQILKLIVKIGCVVPEYLKKEKSNTCDDQDIDETDHIHLKSRLKRKRIAM
jgi:hypothetical protein